MTRTRRKVNIPAIVALLFVGVLALAGVRTPAFAANTGDSTYTDVLADLQKDNSFDITAYPEKAGDYSIQVIGIAESERNELFVYVYRPCGDTYFTQATSINISTAINDSLHYQPHELDLLSRNGTLDKYRVETFEVRPDALRYYDISSIFREWDADIDAQPDNDNTVDEVSYPVAKLYTASTVDGAVTYTCLDTEVVTILNPYVDYLEYNDGVSVSWLVKPFLKKTDAHYIAFDTDKPIDNLVEADISYVTTPYTHDWLLDKYNYGSESGVQVLPLTGEDRGNNPADGWFAHKYEWKRIVKTSDFIDDPETNLNESTKDKIRNTKWVLRFLETERNQYTTGGTYPNILTDGTKVSKVTILRLKFVTDGVTYNLGVVSDKRTGDDTPGNTAPKPSILMRIYDFLTKLFGWNLTYKQFEIIFWCVVAVLALAAILPVLRLFWGRNS